MRVIGRPVLLALLLALCCALCCAASRTISQVEPAATTDTVAAAAAVPHTPRCEKYPPPPPGTGNLNWTARWPQACIGTTVNGFCDATCLQGFTSWPTRPRIHCRANAAGGADWALPIKGKCVPFCSGTPPYLTGVSWPSTCVNGFVEGTTAKPWPHPSTCLGNCSRGGYIGAPEPVAKCLPAKGSSGPAQWRIVERGCRDSMCDGLPGNISWGNRARSGRWPQNCSRLAVGSTCEGICNKGFAADPVPIATCVPPSKSQPYATWELKGACRDDVCSSPNVEAIIGYGDWPYTCDQSAVGANCTAVCWEGYDGDPTPVAVCTKPRENLTRAEWVVYFPDGCKDSTACRDDPCQHIDSAVAGSCIATPGEQPSAPGSGQFACTCFDDHKWDAATKACTPASLLVFAVTQPVDGAQRRRAAGQVPEASWIYMYGASKAADIGNATWVAQDTGTSAANLYAVAVADASTAWAVGSQGIIKRYDGRQWAVERPPTAGASTLHAVAALAGEDSLKAWAGGADGFALYYDGTSWSNVSVNAGQQINDIAAVVEPGGVETVWAVAGDERNPNKLMGYIYKWDAQAESWGTPSEFANITLRGLTALDRYGAWAVGFTNRGAATSRGIVMTWRHASQDWTRDDVYLPVDGYARLNSITAVNYGLLSIAGYFEKTGASGTVSTGLIAYLSYLPDFVRFHDGVIYSGGAVARFNDIAGLSPNTTVAVGSFTEEVAHGPPDNSSGLDWGYPAVLWLDSFPPRVERQEAVSIAYDQEVVGVGMQYVKV